jgi:tetratricopeptide (TPR) repeat protein
MAEQDNIAPANAADASAVSAASRDRADAYLQAQTAFTRLAIERDMREEKLRGWRQAVEHVSGVMKLIFDTAVALVVIVIVVAIGAALYSASHANGLVIEAFSVPPDLAAKGLTGEVVAGKVLDRLSALQDATQSNRAQSSYVNNWGNDIKVQIPETGVSIGQVYQYLVHWLGNEQHISGDIYRDGGQLAVVSRIGGDSSETQYGSDDKIDDLITRAAESVYRRTQPYRYAVYLDSNNRDAEAQPIYRALIAGRDDEDRAWAFVGLSSSMTGRGDVDGAAAMLRRAIAVNPNLLLPYENLYIHEGNLQHDEAQLYWIRQAIAAQARGSDGSITPEHFAYNALQDRAALASALGDFKQELALTRHLESLPGGIGAIAVNGRQIELPICAALRDRACFDDAVALLPEPQGLVPKLNLSAALQLSALAFEDWDAVLKEAAFLVPSLQKLGALGQSFLVRAEYPTQALAIARKGDIAKARAMIDLTALDCAICLRTRGTIAGLAGDWQDADRWFARGARYAPSSPFVWADWGDSQLRRGAFDAATANFAHANQLGPNYPDALELWGEALIGKNRSDLALAKFQEAANNAPNWGRLHLKWGEALLWLGRKDEAHVQFATAAALYLTPSDRAVLHRLTTTAG